MSFSEAHRFARHLVLAEVGPEGQAKLNALALDVPSGRGGDVAAEYLRRAGVYIEKGASVIPVSDTTGDDKDRIAVDTIHGTLAALEALRRGLGMPPHEPLCLESRPKSQDSVK